MKSLPSYSSSVGRMQIHLAFKVKYCHKIFDDPHIKALCESSFRKTLNEMGIQCDGMGIDRDHAHFVLDIGIVPIDQIAKKLKGCSAKKLLKTFPWLKEKYFWGSGVWNPSYYFDSLGRDLEDMKSYVRNQGLPRKEKPLTSFTN